MKKFKFQLTALLKVSELKKEQAEIKFAEALQALNQQKQRLTQFENELQQGMQHYYQLTTAKITIAELMSYSTYFSRMETQIKEQEQAVVTADQYKLECLELLKAAMNKLKSIEQLKERRFTQFKELQLAEEQKALDEIGLQIYTRMVR